MGVEFLEAISIWMPIDFQVRSTSSRIEKHVPTAFLFPVLLLRWPSASFSKPPGDLPQSQNSHPALQGRLL